MEFEREAVPPSQRIRILIRDNFTCVYCGATRQDAKIEVDHVIPVAAGGTSEDGNLVAACWPCNRGKRDRLILDVMDSDVGLYVKAPRAISETAAPAAKRCAAAVPEAAWDAGRKCGCLMAAWTEVLRQWWPVVETLPPAIEMMAFDKPISFAPSFICKGREACDIGPEVRVLVVGWSTVGHFTCEDQLQIRNAAISGYEVPTMILMGPPDFFYGVLVNERHKGTAMGRVVDGFLQPVGEWHSDSWYPDECLDFVDLREPFFHYPEQLALRDFNGDYFVGVYSSAYRKEGETDAI
jgi:hypothetical protein